LFHPSTINLHIKSSLSCKQTEFNSNQGNSKSIQGITPTPPSLEAAVGVSSAMFFSLRRHQNIHGVSLPPAPFDPDHGLTFSPVLELTFAAAVHHTTPALPFNPCPVHSAAAVLGCCTLSPTLMPLLPIPCKPKHRRRSL
jgi:hypothetical protein